MKLPKELDRPKKHLINIQNIDYYYYYYYDDDDDDDDECCKWCLVRHLRPGIII